MITYSELFQFCILIVSIIGLVIQAAKKVIATPFHKLAITSSQ